jgi:hypothetical protein
MQLTLADRPSNVIADHDHGAKWRDCLGTSASMPSRAIPPSPQEFITRRRRAGGYALQHKDRIGGTVVAQYLGRHREALES